MPGMRRMSLGAMCLAKRLRCIASRIGMLLAALAYFILPFDFIPDMIPGLGFTDDAAVLAAVFGLVSSHITPIHRAAAARALDKELPKKE